MEQKHDAEYDAIDELVSIETLLIESNRNTEELVDFGPCGFCGIGHYMAPAGSLWGQCDWCGAE